MKNIPTQAKGRLEWATRLTPCFNLRAAQRQISRSSTYGRWARLFPAARAGTDALNNFVRRLVVGSEPELLKEDSQGNGAGSGQNDLRQMEEAEPAG